MKKFFIIDGNAYIHRAYHALPPLVTSNNQQINAIYGFIKLLFKIKNNFNPDYIAVCFDYPSKNFRHEIFKNYKANRRPLDEALISQMPIAREAAKALNIADIEIQGYEADDLIATLAQNNKKNNMQTVIVTGDKDILQLAEDENILIWNDSKDIMHNTKSVKEKYGVEPKQLTDVFALMGDAVDNVPGIKGIGEKTAVKLIKEFGNLENVLKNADFVKGNLGRLLKQGKEEALLSKKLIELNKQVHLRYEISEFESKDLDLSNAILFFEKYEFKSLLNKYSGTAAKPVATATSSTADYSHSMVKPEIEGNDISSAGAVKPNFLKTHILKKEQSDVNSGQVVSKNTNLSFNVFESEIVDTPEKAIKVVKIIEEAGIFALKTIGSANDFFKMQIVGVSLCIENKAFYFPIGHNYLTAQQMTFNDFKNIFSHLFYSNNIKKVGYDLKQERNIYKTLGLVFNNIYFDIMLASYCLNPAKSHSLPDISNEYVGFTAGDESYFKKGTKKITFADSLIGDNAKYANLISYAIFAMYKIFDFRIKDKKLASLFFDIEMPLIEVLSEMEIAGIKVDSSFLHKFNEKIVFELKKIENNIYKIADKEFNVNSPKQLSSVMFEKLNLPVIKRTKTGYSTDEEVLTELSSYELPAEVLKHRELQKLKSTYIDSTTNYCVYYGSRIHTVFNQAVTTTGRLSSTEPNLQNIPIKSVYGKEFRKVFVPEDDKIFISADYSQIDLRVLAHISNDEKLIEAFKKGADIHSATAREIFNIPPREPLPGNLRSAAKSINFGIVYGMSPFGLSKQLNIPFGKAKEYIDGYFDRYKGVKIWMKHIVEQALKDGYVSTITGRIRYMPELNSNNVLIRNAGERIALNTPVQGSSADIIKIAMINIYNEIKLKGYKSLMLLQVHDDLLFEVPSVEAEKLVLIIKDKMENSVKLRIPVVVDIKTGKNWGEMQKI
ncbi:MAG: DNA polymerase I [Endomicrobium sp.]|jgi:DNA polymerase-1|nr:DNA polymerase I [Endomicrobium sp.]